MNAHHTTGGLVHLVSKWIAVGLTGVLFTCSSIVSAASHPVEGQGTISGSALVGSGAGLSQVVVTLEPLDGSKEVAAELKRVQTEQATVILRGGRFTPGTLVASVGTTASFRSLDGLFHIAELSLAGRPITQLALPSSGLDNRYVFTAPGVVTLKDGTNPNGEVAYIVVTDNRYFGVSDGQGRFTISDVPAGTYSLRAFHRDLGSRSFAVTVPQSNKTMIQFVLEEPRIVELPLR